MPRIRSVHARRQVGLPHLAPMLATSSADLPKDLASYTFEWKWDGVRAIARWDGRLHLDSRNLLDITTSYSTKFKPEAYHDEYRERVMEMIEKKARGEKVVTRPEAEKPSPRGHGLMAALEASLKRARSAVPANSSANGNGHPHARARPTRRRRSA